MHPSYIVSLSSVLLKLIQFRLLYIVYAAGLAPETTFRKKVLYNILYKLLQLFWPVEKYLCFKRHVGPIVQKGHIVNTFLSLALAFSREEETDVILHNRLYTPSIHTFIHPSIHSMRSTIYISWKVHASISNTEKTKYSHLDLETMIMWRPWYWETVKQKTTCTSTVRKKDWEINLDIQC